MRLFPLLLAGCWHGGHGDDAIPAPAEEAAECCLGAKWWEAHDDGWGSPRFGTVTLNPGESHTVTMTPTKNLHFRFEACGDPTVVDIDLLLLDPKAVVLVRDDQPGREPRMTWVADTSRQRTYVVWLRETSTGGPAAIAWMYASQGE